MLTNKAKTKQRWLDLAPGDTVVVIAGKDKGKQGEVLRTLPHKGLGCGTQTVKIFRLALDLCRRDELFGLQRLKARQGLFEIGRASCRERV